MRDQEVVGIWVPVERLRKLEAVAEAARQFLSTCSPKPCRANRTTGVCLVSSDVCLIERIERALAALDGKEEMLWY